MNIIHIQHHRAASLLRPISSSSFFNAPVSLPFTSTKRWHIKGHNWALHKFLFPGETLMPAQHRKQEKETMEKEEDRWGMGGFKDGKMEGYMEMKYRQEVRRRKTFWGLWDCTAKGFRGATGHVCSRCVYPCGKLRTGVSLCVWMCWSVWVCGWIQYVR